MPGTIANSTDRRPAGRLIRIRYMIADSASLPWLSVRSGLDQSASGMPKGGLKLSISDGHATSIGSCGAIRGANTAATISSNAMTADTRAIGKVQKL